MDYTTLKEMINDTQLKINQLNHSITVQEYSELSSEYEKEVEEMLSLVELMEEMENDLNEMSYTQYLEDTNATL